VTDLDLNALRQRLLAARRDRMARNGRLGRTVAAFHCIADALDADNMRTAAERALPDRTRSGRRKAGPVGYGWGMIDQLAMRACTPADFKDRFGRIADEDGLQAAMQYGDEITRARAAVRKAIADALHADPRADVPTPAQIRAIAGQLAAEATPLRHP
jgi:hypothetical protein